MDSYVISMLLISMPLVFGLLFIAKEDLLYRKVVSYILFILSSILAIMLAFNGTGMVKLPSDAFKIMEGIISIAEVAIIVFLYYVSLKHKRYGTLALTVIQTVLYFVTLFYGKKEAEAYLCIDKLSIAMALIVNIIGTLIVIFANNYLVHYEKERKLKNRKKLFYGVVCIFLSAMNGLILSDSLAWMYFFWEVTTLTSFILISYNNDEEALHSGFLALFLNLMGGLCFSVGILIFGNVYNVGRISEIINNGKMLSAFTLPIFLLCIAGFVKSAQMPFQGWLLGAMVAPTPVSALLHSSTMVKAGVFLIIKLAPAYAGTWLGTAIALYGAFTFLVCSVLGVTQRNGKRVLAYSTIANLGLIISSAGLGTSVALTAAIMLTIFHAISKALLFLCAGEIEEIIGSRDIEDMTGLVKVAPYITIIAAIGMSSMLMPPFGVLITKWISMEAAAQNPIVALLLVVGSAFMSVLWIKWLGTILSSPVDNLKPKQKVGKSTLFPLTVLAGLIIGASCFITQIFNFFVNPEVSELLKAKNQVVINSGNVNIGVGNFNDLLVFYVIIAAAVVYFLASKFLFKNVKVKEVYMCGENTTEKGNYFRSGNGEESKAHVANMYLTRFFREKELTNVASVISTAIIVCGLMGGLL